MSDDALSISDKLKGSKLTNKKTPVFLRRIYALLQVI